VTELARLAAARATRADDTGANLTAMHQIGHALCDATMRMGGTCEGDRCTRVDDGKEDQPPAPETNGPDANGKTPPQKKEGERAAQSTPVPVADAPVAPAPAAPAPAPAPIERVSPGTDQVLQAIAGLATQVTGFTAAINAVSERVRQVESEPAPIGRAPAAPVDKVLAGSSAQSTPGAVEALVRLAEAESDPQAKTVLLKAAATESIRSLQSAGRT
jgi:hypothetical protein